MNTREISSLGHYWRDWTIDVAPTCTEPGTKYIKCKACSQILETQEISPTGHTESKWIIDVDATCYEPGERHTVCVLCGIIIQRDTIPAIHDVDEENCIYCNVTPDEYFTFTYLPETDSYSVGAYIRWEMPTVINIPNTYCGKSVTAISDGAFESCEFVSVGIPNSVTVIGNQAFIYCQNLTSIKMSDNITTIGDSAFCLCSKLESISIPDSVTKIGVEAFCDCTSLENVYITDMASWCNITFGFRDPTSNPISYAKNFYLNGELVTELVIPDGITEIKDCAFSGYSGLIKVIVPDSVTSIGEYSFAWCYGLTDFVGGDNITSIGSKAFYECTSLASFVVGDKVTYIDYETFYCCESLTDLTIGRSVTYVDVLAFYGCISLNNVYYKGSEEEWAKNIGDSAFGYINVTIHFNYVSNE